MPGISFRKTFLSSKIICCTFVNALPDTMFYKFSSTLLAAGGMLLIGACGVSQPVNDSASAETGDAIVVTDVDFDPESKVLKNEPIANYLGSKLNKAGITRGEVKIAPDVDTLNEWMSSGEVNLYFDSIFPAMLVMEETGAQPILSRWKDGVAEYNTLFITRKDSELDSLESLQGNMLAMQSPSSSSGFMFPVVELINADLNPVAKAEANHLVEDNEVGYVFAGEDEITVEWILNGKVQAGALDSATWAEVSEDDKAELKVLAETVMYPRAVVVVGPNLSSDQVDIVKSVLMDMEESREGREILEDFSDTVKFEEFPEGADAAVSQLEDAYQSVKEHLAAQEILN